MDEADEYRVNVRENLFYENLISSLEDLEKKGYKVSDLEVEVIKQNRKLEGMLKW